MKPIFTLSFLFWMSVSLASGFSDDSDKAFKSAAKTGKPLLMVFHAIWCPACNELEETVFESQGFLERSKNFELLKVDADSPKSWKLKSQFHVGGYPTTIFATPKGVEIYRVVGYREPKEFFRVMDLVSQNAGTSFNKSCSLKDDESLWRCAQVCLEREDKVCAKKSFEELLPKLSVGTARYDLTKTYFADSLATPELRRAEYEKLIQESPTSPKALEWILSYLETFPGGEGFKPNARIIDPVLRNYKKMMVDPRKDELGIPDTDIAQLRALISERLHRQVEAKTAWKESAELFEAKAKEQGEKFVARGFTLERIGCLEGAGEYQKAMDLADEYIKKFPKEFTFYFKKAAVLNRLRKFSEAVPVAKLAYENSYGDNKVRSATMLLTLYAKTANRKEAEKVYKEVRASITPQAELEVRTHKYLKSLDEAWSQFPKS